MGTLDGSNALDARHVRGMLVFAEVVRRGTFAAAARQLGLTRAAVSHQVKQLEDGLGVRLLNRTTRNQSLTDAGRVFVASCMAIADEIDIANRRMENIRNEPAGTIRFTCSVNLGLQSIVPALSAFQRLYPKIEIDLMMTDDIVDIVAQGIDVAIRGGKLADSELMARSLGRSRYYICASADYLREHGRPGVVEELVDHAWVVYTLGSRDVTLTRQGRTYTVTPTGPIRTNNAASRLYFTLHGHGLARLPEYDVIARVASGELEILLPDHECGALEIQAVHHRGATGSLSIKLLLDFLEAYGVASAGSRRES